ncbi:MAG TPA: hypothetical protein VF881_01405 [Polyangiaceae bacterium]
MRSQSPSVVRAPCPAGKGGRGGTNRNGGMQHKRSGKREKRQRDVTRVTEWEFKAASRLEKDAVLALESAIYYTCWQAFRAEKASGKPIEKGVPNDMAEGSERVATQVADFIEKTDRFEDYCASSPSMLGRAMADFPKKLAGKVERKVPSRSMRLGFVRDEANGRGMVACFVSDKPAGLDSLKERLERFFSTWQLGEFGKFRYAFAEKTKAGDTHVVTVWADTGLDIRAMFPAEGDAAGADSRVLPRPQQSRRMLSAAAEEMPYGLRLYTSTERADAVKRYYDDWMAKNRFSPVVGGEHDGTIPHLRDDGYQAFVTIGEEDGHTSVTLLEAGRTDVAPNATVQATEE